MGGSQNQGYHFGGPSNKDYNILGSILGSPYVGKLPNIITLKQCRCDSASRANENDTSEASATPQDT